MSVNTTTWETDGYFNGTGVSDDNNALFTYTKPLQDLVDDSNVSLGVNLDTTNVYATYVGGENIFGSGIHTLSTGTSVSLTATTNIKTNLRLGYISNTQGYSTRKCFDIWDTNHPNPFTQNLLHGQSTPYTGSIRFFNKFKNNNCCLLPVFAIYKRQITSSVTSITSIADCVCTYQYLIDTYGQSLFDNGYDDNYFIGNMLLVPYYATNYGDDGQSNRQAGNGRLVVIADGATSRGVIYGVYPSAIGNAPSSDSYRYTSNNFASGATQWASNVTPNYLNSSSNPSYNTYASKAGGVTYQHQPFARQSNESNNMNYIAVDWSIDDIPIGDIMTDNDTYPLGYSIVSNGSMFIKTSTTGNPRCFLFTIYNKKRIEKEISAFGLWWTYYPSKASTGVIGSECTDSELHLGKMYADGTTDGTYTSGEEASKEIQASMDDIIDESPVIPVTPGTEIDADDDINEADEGDIDINKDASIGSTQHFITMYAMSHSQIVSMGQSLWQYSTLTDVIKNFVATAQNFFSSDYSLYLSEYMDYFVNLRWFPFDIPSVTSSYSVGNPGVYVGTAATLLECSSPPHVVTESLVYIDGGSVDVPSVYRSFMDFEPYASITAYIPYCGTIELLPSQVVGSTLELTYLVDLTTGGCTAIVRKVSEDASFPIAQVQGVIGFDQMMTGNNANNQTANMLGAIVGVAGSSSGNVHSLLSDATNVGNAAETAGGIGAGMLTGSIEGAGVIAGALTTVATSAMTIRNASATTPMACGSSSCCSALISPQTAYIQIKRKHIQKPTNYAHSVGNVESTTFVLGNLTGWTVCENPDLSGIQATQEEKNMIKQLLIHGVYL